MRIRPKKEVQDRGLYVLLAGSCRAAQKMHLPDPTLGRDFHSDRQSHSDNHGK